MTVICIASRLVGNYAQELFSFYLSASDIVYSCQLFGNLKDYNANSKPLWNSQFWSICSFSRNQVTVTDKIYRFFPPSIDRLLLLFACLQISASKAPRDKQGRYSDKDSSMNEQRHKNHINSKQWKSSTGTHKHTLW